MRFLNQVWIYLVFCCVILVSLHGSNFSVHASERDQFNHERNDSLQKSFDPSDEGNHSNLDKHIANNSHQQQHTREARSIVHTSSNNRSRTRTKNGLFFSYLEDVSSTESELIPSHSADLSRIYKTITGLLIKLENVAKMKDEIKKLYHAKETLQSGTLFKETQFSEINGSRVTVTNFNDSNENMIKFVETVSHIFNNSETTSHRMIKVDLQRIIRVVNSFIRILLNSKKYVQSPLARTMKIWSEVLSNSNLTMEHNVNDFIEGSQRLLTLQTNVTREEENLLKYVMNQLQLLKPTASVTANTNLTTSSGDAMSDNVGTGNSSGEIRYEMPDILPLIKIFNTTDSDRLLDLFMNITFMEMIGKYERAGDYQDWIFIRTLNSFNRLLSFEASYDFLLNLENTIKNPFLRNYPKNRTFHFMKINKILEVGDSPSERRTEKFEVYLMQIMKDTLSTLTDDLLPRYVLTCLLELLAQAEAEISERNVSNTTGEDLSKNETVRETEYFSKVGSLAAFMDDTMTVPELGSVLQKELQRVDKYMSTLDTNEDSKDTTQNLQLIEELMASFDSFVLNQTFSYVASKQNVTTYHPENLLRSTLRSNTNNFTNTDEGRAVYGDGKSMFSKSFLNILQNWVKDSRSNASIIRKPLSILQELVSRQQPVETQSSNRRNELTEHMLLELTNLVMLDGISDLLTRTEELWRLKLKQSKKNLFKFEQRSQFNGNNDIDLEIVGRIKDALGLLTDAHLQTSLLMSFSDLWDFLHVKIHNELGRNSSEKGKTSEGQNFSKLSRNISVEVPSKGDNLYDDRFLSFVNRTSFPNVDTEIVYYLLNHLNDIKDNVSSRGEWDALNILPKISGITLNPSNDSYSSRKFVEEAVELFSKSELCSKCGSGEHDNRLAVENPEGNDELTGGMTQIFETSTVLQSVTTHRKIAESLNMSSTQKPSKTVDDNAKSLGITTESTFIPQKLSTNNVAETFLNLPPLMTRSISNAPIKDDNFGKDVFGDESERHHNETAVLSTLSKIAETFLSFDSDSKLAKSILAYALLSNISETTRGVKDEYPWLPLSNLNETLRLVNFLLLANREEETKIITKLPENTTVPKEPLTFVKKLEKSELAGPGLEMPTNKSNVSKATGPMGLLTKTPTKTQSTTSFPVTSLQVLPGKFPTVNNTLWRSNLTKALTAEEQAKNITASPNAFNQRLLSAVTKIARQINKTEPSIELAEIVNNVMSRLKLFPMLADNKIEHLLDELVLIEKELAKAKPVKQVMTTLKTVSPKLETTVYIPVKEVVIANAEFLKMTTESTLELQELPTTEVTETSLNLSQPLAPSSYLSFGNEGFDEESKRRRKESAVLFALSEIAEIIIRSDSESELTKIILALALLKNVNETREEVIKEYPLTPLMKLNETLQLVYSVLTSNRQKVSKTVARLPENGNVSKSQLALSELINFVRKVNKTEPDIKLEVVVKNLISSLQSIPKLSDHKMENLLNELVRIDKELTEPKQVEQDVTIFETSQKWNEINYIPAQGNVIGNTETFGMTTEMSVKLQEQPTIKVAETSPKVSSSLTPSTPHPTSSDLTVGNDVFDEGLERRHADTTYLSALREITETIIGSDSESELTKSILAFAFLNNINKTREGMNETYPWSPLLKLNETLQLVDSLLSKNKQMESKTFPRLPENAFASEYQRILSEVMTISRLMNRTEPGIEYDEAIKNLSSSLEAIPKFVEHKTGKLLNEFVSMAKELAETKPVDEEVTTPKTLIFQNSSVSENQRLLSEVLSEVMNIARQINKTEPGIDFDKELNHLSSSLELIANLNNHNEGKLLNELVSMKEELAETKPMEQEVTTSQTVFHTATFSEYQRLLSEVMNIARQINKTEPGIEFDETLKNLSSNLKLIPKLEDHKLGKVMTELVSMAKELAETKAVEQEVITSETIFHNATVSQNQRLLSEVMNLARQINETKPGIEFDESLKNLSANLKAIPELADHKTGKLLNEFVSMAKEFAETKPVEQEVTTIETKFPMLKTMVYSLPQTTEVGTTEALRMTNEKSVKLQEQSTTEVAETSLSSSPSLTSSTPYSISSYSSFGNNVFDEESETSRTETAVLSALREIAETIIHSDSESELTKSILEFALLKNINETKEGMNKQYPWSPLSEVNKTLRLVDSFLSANKRIPFKTVPRVPVNSNVSDNQRIQSEVMNIAKEVNRSETGIEFDEALKNLTSSLESIPMPEDHKTLLNEFFSKAEELVGTIPAEQEVTKLKTTSHNATVSANQRVLSEVMNIVRQINKTEPGIEFNETLKNLSSNLKLIPKLEDHKLGKVMTELVSMAKELAETKAVEQEVITSETIFHNATVSQNQRLLSEVMNLARQINETKPGIEFDESLKNLSANLKAIPELADHKTGKLLNEFVSMAKEFAETKPVEQEVTTIETMFPMLKTMVYSLPQTTEVGTTEALRMTNEKSVKLQEQSTTEVAETSLSSSPSLTSSTPYSISSYSSFGNNVFDEESETSRTETAVLSALREIAETIIHSDSESELTKNILEFALLKNINETKEGMNKQYPWLPLSEVNKTLRLVDSLLSANKRIPFKTVPRVPVNSNVSDNQRIQSEVMNIAKEVNRSETGIEFDEALKNLTSSLESIPMPEDHKTLLNEFFSKAEELVGTIPAEQEVTKLKTTSHNATVSANQRVLSEVMNIVRQINKTEPGIEFNETLKNLSSSLKAIPKLVDHKTGKLFTEFVSNEKEFTETKPVKQEVTTLETIFPMFKTMGSSPTQTTQVGTTEPLRVTSETSVSLREQSTTKFPETSLNFSRSMTPSTPHSISSYLSFGNDVFDEESEKRRTEKTVLSALSEIAETVIHSDSESELTKSILAFALLKKINETREEVSTEYPWSSLLKLNETLRLVDSFLTANRQTISNTVTRLLENPIVSENQNILTQVMNIARQINTTESGIELDEAIEKLTLNLKSIPKRADHKMKTFLHDILRIEEDLTQPKLAEEEMMTLETSPELGTTVFSPTQAAVIRNAEGFGMSIETTELQVPSTTTQTTTTFPVTSPPVLLQELFTEEGTLWKSNLIKAPTTEKQLINITVASKASYLRILSEVMNITREANKTGPGTEMDEELKNLISSLKSIPKLPDIKMESLLNDFVRMQEELIERKSVGKEVTTPETTSPKLKTTIHSLTQRNMIGNTEPFGMTTETSIKLKEQWATKVAETSLNLPSTQKTPLTYSVHSPTQQALPGIKGSMKSTNGMPTTLQTTPSIFEQTPSHILSPTTPTKTYNTSTQRNPLYEIFEGELQKKGQVKELLFKLNRIEQAIAELNPPSDLGKARLALDTVSEIGRNINRSTKGYLSSSPSQILALNETMRLVDFLLTATEKMANVAATTVLEEGSTPKETGLKEPETTVSQTKGTTPPPKVNTVKGSTITTTAPYRIQPTTPVVLTPLKALIKETFTESIPRTVSMTEKLANYTVEQISPYQRIRSDLTNITEYINTTDIDFESIEEIVGMVNEWAESIPGRKKVITQEPFVMETSKSIHVGMKATEPSHNLSRWNIEYTPPTKVLNVTGTESSSVPTSISTAQKRTEGTNTTPPSDLEIRGKSNISSSLTKILVEHVEDETHIINDIRENEGRVKDMFKNISEGIRDLTRMVHDLLDLKTNLVDFVSLEKEKFVLGSNITSKPYTSGASLKEESLFKGKGEKVVNETGKSLISSKYRFHEGLKHAPKLSSIIDFIKETFDNISNNLHNETYLAGTYKATKVEEEQVILNAIDLLSTTTADEENRRLLELLVDANISLHEATNLFRWLQLLESFEDQRLNVSMSKRILNWITSLSKERNFMRHNFYNISKYPPDVNLIDAFMKENLDNITSNQHNETYLAHIYKANKLKKWIFERDHGGNITINFIDFLSRVATNEEIRRLLDFLVDYNISLHRAAKMYDWLQLLDEFDQRLNDSMIMRFLHRFTSLSKEDSFMRERLHEISKYGPDLSSIIAFMTETFGNIAKNSQNETYLPDIREAYRLKNLVEEVEGEENATFNIVDFLSSVSANGENQRLLDILVGFNISLHKTTKLYNWLQVLDLFTNNEKDNISWFTNTTQEDQRLSVSMSKRKLNRIASLSKERNFMRNLLIDLFREKKVNQTSIGTSINRSLELRNLSSFGLRVNPEPGEQQKRLPEDVRFIKKLMQTEELLSQRILSSRKLKEDIEKMRSLMNLRENMTLWQWIEMMSNFFNRSRLNMETGEAESEMFSLKGRKHGQHTQTVTSTTPSSPAAAKPYTPPINQEVTTEGLSALLNGQVKGKSFVVHTVQTSLGGEQLERTNHSFTTAKISGKNANEYVVSDNVETGAQIWKTEGPIEQGAVQNRTGSKEVSILPWNHVTRGQPSGNLTSSIFMAETPSSTLRVEDFEGTYEGKKKIIVGDKTKTSSTIQNLNQPETATPSVFSFDHKMESSTPSSNVKLSSATSSMESQIKISEKSFAQGRPKVIFSSSTVQSILPWAQWSAWSSWGQCTVTCGQGRKVRRRECQMEIEGAVIPAESCFGFPDEGMTCEVIPCRDTMPPQAQQSILPKWSEWGRCSASCGEGERTRSRQCNPNPAVETCHGESIETERCLLQTCPDTNKQPIPFNKEIMQQRPENTRRKPIEDTNRPKKHHATLTPGTISAIVAASVLFLLMVLACTVAHSKRILRKAQGRADVNDFI